MLDELKLLKEKAIEEYKAKFLEEIPVKVKNAAEKRYSQLNLWNIPDNEVEFKIIYTSSGFWDKFFGKHYVIPVFSGFSLEIWNRCLELGLDPQLDYYDWDGRMFDKMIVIKW